MTKEPMEGPEGPQAISELCGCPPKPMGDGQNNAVPMEEPYSKAGQETRINFLRERTKKCLDFMSGGRKFEEYNQLQGNIENYIGMTLVPTGVMGPLCVNGTEARGDFYVPMATTEGTLIASYSRGAKAAALSSGITSVCLLEAVQRCPLFKFGNIEEACRFVLWATDHLGRFKGIADQASKHAKLKDLKANIEGNQVVLTFEFTTGDAAGQNMITFCTEDICKYIIENTPVNPRFWFIESNYSGDKKATALALAHVRGKRVSAEIEIPKEVVNRVLKTTPEWMTEYWKGSTLAVIQSGAIGAQGHVANGLTALFLACGQDVACISEAAVGITRMELVNGKDLYASVTLPNLIVGTVGGGTHLATQRECLELLGCTGAGSAKKFSEICGAVALAGEISIAAALSAGQFTKAHRQFGRKKIK